MPGDVVTWIRARTEALHLSTISVAEIEAGIAKLRRTGATRQADHLRERFDRILDDYADRVPWSSCRPCRSHCRLRSCRWLSTRCS